MTKEYRQVQSSTYSDIIAGSSNKFKEEDHPRDAEGKFVDKNGGNSSKTSGQDVTHNDIIKKTDIAQKVSWEMPTTKAFKETLLRAKESQDEYKRWRVSSDYSEDDYKDAILFSTNGGSVVAVMNNGDIVSVCKNENDKFVRGSMLIKQAVSNGGDRLDAFGSKLYEFYTMNGFEPVSWTLFNREFAPEDWRPEYGEEEIVFYKYTGKKTDMTFKEFISTTKPYSDYTVAKNYRDREIEK